MTPFRRRGSAGLRRRSGGHHQGRPVRVHLLRACDAPRRCQRLGPYRCSTLANCKLSRALPPARAYAPCTAGNQPPNEKHPLRRVAILASLTKKIDPAHRAVNDVETSPSPIDSPRSTAAADHPPPRAAYHASVARPLRRNCLDLPQQPAGAAGVTLRCAIQLAAPAAACLSE